MRLVEFCEPLFQVVCRYHRLGRTGVEVSLAKVKGDISAVLEDRAERARQDPHLQNQWEQVEPPLVYFIDDLIGGSRLSIAEDWDYSGGLGSERGRLGGDEDFFRMLDDWLDDRSALATERLEVLLTCLALGFGGMHRHHPEELDRLIAQCRARVGVPSLEGTEPLAPAANRNVDTTDNVGQPTQPVTFMAAIFVGLLVMMLVASVGIYRDGVATLRDHLAAIAGESRSDADPASVPQPESE